MKNFIITTDSACDYSLNKLKENDINVIFYHYSNGTTTYLDSMEETNTLAFFKAQREGTRFKTSQINPIEYANFFRPLLKYHLPIIHISLGSGLSNTVNSANLAISMLKEEDSNIDIRVIDSLCASTGIALLVNKAKEFLDLNYSIDDAYIKLKELTKNLHAYYTTNTLTYFAQGGRLSKVNAMLGNAFKINPVLKLNEAGNLKVYANIRGTNKAYDTIVSCIKENVIDASKQTLYVTHADNLEGANLLISKIKEEINFKNIEISLFGPIIGTHTGPGLVTVFFTGKKRTD